MSFENVLVGGVLIVLIAAIAVKEWERHVRRQYETKMNIGKRRIFARSKRQKINRGN